MLSVFCALHSIPIRFYSGSVQVRPCSAAQVADSILSRFLCEVESFELKMRWDEKTSKAVFFSFGIKKEPDVVKFFFFL